MAPEPAHLCPAIQERYILRTAGCTAAAAQVCKSNAIETLELLVLVNHNCRKKSHFKITPDVRRELQAASCRDVEMMETDNGLAGQPAKMYTDADVEYEG